MKKSKITTILYCLILFINACGPSSNKTEEGEVTIGNQTWTSKNLDVETYRNGEFIPQVQEKTTWANLSTGAWCYYQNNTVKGRTYGKLYNWYAINDPRGLAPKGYHIPTDAEWTTLTTSLGGVDLAGPKMKEVGASHWPFPKTGATKMDGFAGLPGGCRASNGGFYYVGAYGYWWCSSESSPDCAWSRYLNINFGSEGTYYNTKQNGFSVRCLRD